ncbi:hypothetical protein Btru_020362 [Bulinus truncatus]|nr:hypothetical protein Btru_020362 [Bulinus truncatus]
MFAMGKDWLSSLTAEEKEKLYDSIGYDDSNRNISYPKKNLSCNTESFAVEGASIEHELIPILTSDIGVYAPSVNQVFTLTLNLNHYTWIKRLISSLNVQPVEVVYDEHSISEVTAFFSTASRGMDIKSAAVKTFTNVAYVSQAGLQYIIETYTDATMSEIESRLYDQFNIKISDVKVLLADSADDWHTAQIQPNSEYHILPSVQLIVTFFNAVKPDFTQLPSSSMATIGEDMTDSHAAANLTSFHLVIKTFWYKQVDRFLPESIPWLLSQGRQDDAAGSIHLLAKQNGVSIGSDVVKYLKDTQTPLPDKDYYIIDCLRTWRMAKISLNVWFFWLVTCLVYYGLSLNTENMPGNHYLIFCIIVAVDIPADLVSIVLLNYFGRRKPLMITMVLAGIGCILSECLPNNTGSNEEGVSNITQTNEDVKKMHLNNLSGVATSQISRSFPKGNQDYESLVEKFSQVESNISLLQISTNSVEESYRKMCKMIEELNDEKGTHDKKIKKIHQKLHSMEKHNESLANQNEDIGAKLDVRIEEVMQELHTASDFMTGLQKQNEKLVNQMNASKKTVTDLTNSFQNSQIQQTDLTNQIDERWQTKAIEDDNVNKKINDITEKFTVINERYSKLNDQMEILSDKIKESEKNDNVLSINNEELSTLQQALNDQVQHLNTIDENMKMKEESDTLKLTEIQNKFEATNHSVVDVQSQFESLLSKTEKSNAKMLTDLQDNIQITNKSFVNIQSQLKFLSSKIDKANKDIHDISSNARSQKKDISDISAKLSALKSSTDQFIDSQKETTLDLNNKVASINIKMKYMFDDKAHILTRIKELASLVEVIYEWQDTTGIRVKTDLYEEPIILQASVGSYNIRIRLNLVRCKFTTITDFFNETTDEIVAFNARVKEDEGTFDLETDEIMTCFNCMTVELLVLRDNWSMQRKSPNAEHLNTGILNYKILFKFSVKPLIFDTSEACNFYCDVYYGEKCGKIFEIKINTEIIDLPVNMYAT